MNDDFIPFNKPYLTGRELDNISKAHRSGALAGDGEFSEHCEKWLAGNINCERALLTHSCTAALEMAALLLNIAPGDEIVMPSFTFVSTANAFVLRGGIPVFADICENTLNIDPAAIEAAITDKTRAICPVHYAGVSCDMDRISDIARRHNLAIIEDAAQGLMSSYKGRPLGSLGSYGAVSFHETKNVMCGQGGALFINHARAIERAEILHQKGTDRSRFKRGEIDKYSWRSIGSSFLLGEMPAAFLAAQLDEAVSLTQTRLGIWDNYHAMLKPLEGAGYLRRPIIPKDCVHNAHMYYILISPDFERQTIIERLRSKGVNAVFHYVPLHSSEAGQSFGRVDGDLFNTNDLSARLLRLPLWPGLTYGQQERVFSALKDAFMTRA